MSWDHRTRRRRADIHFLTGLTGLFLNVVWSVAMLWSDADARYAPSWSVVNLVGFGAVLAMSWRLRRDGARPAALDAACSGLACVLAVSWVHATGSVGSYLLAFPPLIVLGQAVIGSALAGAVAFGTTLTLHAVLVTLEVAGRLPVDPVHSSRTGSGLVVPLSMLAAVYLVCWTLGAFVRRVKRNRGPERVATAEPALQRALIISEEFRVEGIIGRGASGTVYAGVRLRDRRPVALKVLHSHLSEAPEAVARFLHEAAVASKLGGSNGVSVLASGISRDGAPYIVMERLQGEDLATLLARRGTLGLAETVAIVEQVARVLDVVAGQGIVHRDVKPHNVFVLAQGEPGSDVRLLDFGICRLQDGALGPGVARTATLLGTPGFLAPEQVSDAFGEVGPHTDVFALGAVAYEALSGVRAFPGRSPAEAVYEALNRTPVPIRRIRTDLPAAVEQVLALALAKDPALRFRTAGEFAEQLKAAEQGRLSAATSARAGPLVEHGSTFEQTVTIAG